MRRCWPVSGCKVEAGAKATTASEAAIELIESLTRSYWMAKELHTSYCIHLVNKERQNNNKGLGFVACCRL